MDNENSKNNTQNLKDGDVTVELLAEMYRNVTMGSENLACVVPDIKDKFLLQDVTSQLEKYVGYTTQTEKLLNKRGVKPKEPSLMKKVMSRGGIAVNTAIDASNRHIAEMIEKGTRTGVDQLEEKMIEFKSMGCDDDAVRLCEEIVTFERTEADRIKDYC